MLGFASACSDPFSTMYGPAPDMYGPPMPMYGPAPSGWFAPLSIRGRVVDANQNPIPGISISDESKYINLRTDAEGNFAHNGRTYIEEESITLQVSDIDGLQNGYYKDQEVQISVRPDETTEAENDYTADEITITMDKKL